MTYEEYMQSRGYVYAPNVAGTSAGRGRTYSGWGTPNTGRGGGIRPLSQGISDDLLQQYQRNEQRLADRAQNPIATTAAAADWKSRNLGSYVMNNGGIDPFADPGEMSFNLSTGAMKPVVASNPRVSYSGSAPNPYSGQLDEDGNPPGLGSYDAAKSIYSGGYVPWNIDNVYEGLSNRQPFNLNALWGGTQYAQGRVTDWSHLDPTQYQSNVLASTARNKLWNEYDSLAAQGKTPAKNPDEVALDFYVKNVGPGGNTFGYGPGANTALISEAITHQFLNSPDVSQARGIKYNTPQWKMADIDAFGTAHQAGVPTWQVFEKQQYGSGFSIGSLIPMIIGAVALGPMAAAFGGGITGTALAGALIGGTTAEIGGGDFLKGALTGGVGGALSGGLGAAGASQAELASMVESGTSGVAGAALEASSLGGGLSSISSTLVEAGLPKPMADALVKAATVAVKTGVAGGDVEQAVLGSLVNSGVGAGVSEGLAEADVSKDLAKAISSIATPVISTAVQGGDVSTALTNTLIKGGFALAGDTINEVLNTTSPTQTATAPVAPEVSSPLQSANAEAAPPAVDPAWGVNPPSQDIGAMIGSETPFDLADAETGAGVDLTGGTGLPIQTEPVPEALPVDEAINNIVNQPIEPPAQDQAQNVLPPQETVNNIPDQPIVNDQTSGLTVLQPQETSDLTEPVPSPYDGLTGYTPEVIDQLNQGTYAGPEAPVSDTEVMLRDILGDETVDQLYSEGLPASSSAYEGLGYDANTINQLMEGPSATQNEDGTYTFGGYSGPEQTEAEVREQMGDELYDLAYSTPDTEASGTTPGGSGSTAGGSGTTSGGLAAASTPTAQQAAGVNYGALIDKISGILNPPQPKYDSPIKAYLQPGLISTGKEAQPMGKDYSQIIGELSSVLAKRGYKVGGEVRTEDNPVEYIAGPEDRYYARHMKRGFAVNGPGTGQSDDIPTMLADGEYVFDADTVAALGDGSSKAGADVLNKFRESIRAHKRSAPTDKIPPKAKSPLEYLKTAQKPKGSKHG